jgi:hypothetical protein
VERSEKITMVDREGNRREYRSVEELPPAQRAQMEKLREDALKGQEDLLQGLAAAKGDKPGLISRQTTSIYRVRDAAGNERVFHSLEELPPEMRAALQRAQLVPGKVEWRGKAIQVRAELIPRFLWSSASIDVYLDGEKIFRTGGKIQSIGSHVEKVRFGGSEHDVELKWGRSQNFRFPYQLRIDGALVMESVVQVENQQLIFIPALVLIVLFFGIVFGLKELLQFALKYIEGT